jgi:hypothetical protein
MEGVDHPVSIQQAQAKELVLSDHEQLTFYHNGIKRRLTDVYSHVIQELLA